MPVGSQPSWRDEHTSVVARPSGAMGVSPPLPRARGSGIHPRARVLEHDDEAGQGFGRVTFLNTGEFGARCLGRYDSLTIQEAPPRIVLEANAGMCDFFPSFDTTSAVGWIENLISVNTRLPGIPLLEQALYLLIAGLVTVTVLFRFFDYRNISSGDLLLLVWMCLAIWIALLTIRSCCRQRELEMIGLDGRTDAGRPTFRIALSKADAARATAILIGMKEYYAQYGYGSADADDDDTDSSSDEGSNDNDRVRDTQGAAAAAVRASDERDVVVAQPVWGPLPSAPPPPHATVPSGNSSPQLLIAPPV
jgi:hypothetical protein